MIFTTAGHSATDPGAVSDNRKESDLNIEMRGLIVQSIFELDPSVIVWQDSDSDSLSMVISKIKRLATPKCILLDIHFNAASSSKVKGTESFIALNARENTKRIAHRLTELSAGMLKTPNRGVKLEDESQHKRLGILHSSASSILWEVEFISNKAFMDNYDLMKKRLAMGIANILLQEYFKLQAL